MNRSVRRQSQWTELLSLKQLNCCTSRGPCQRLRGAPGGTRTHDLYLAKEALFPTELPGRSHNLSADRNTRQWGNVTALHERKRSGRMTTPFVGSPLGLSTLTKTTPVYQRGYIDEAKRQRSGLQNRSVRRQSQRTERFSRSPSWLRYVHRITCSTGCQGRTGAPGRTRTHDFPLAKRALCPTELPGRSHNLRAILEAGQ